MTKTELKKAVTEGILVRLTFDGAFQRAKIYKGNVSDRDRREFRKSIAAILPKILLEIQHRKRYTNSDHYNTIERFSKVVTAKHATILSGNKLRIGNAQKFLNLYWKVCWILKKGTPRPIHCPFDSIVIKKLGKSVKSFAWTKFESMADYKKLVDAAIKLVGPGRSIAEWELEIYQQAINYKEQVGSI